jgi:hypothetical protein
MKLRVECYSGNKADERPVRFYLGEQLRMVEEILDQWYGPNDIFFKVRADDGNLYILRADATIDSHWSKRIVPGGQSRMSFETKTADVFGIG